MDGQLDTHFINHLEPKLSNSRFLRVDSDVVDKLIKKEDTEESKLSVEEKDQLSHMFESQLPTYATFTVSFENLKETDDPIMVTQSEFMRRMKDMSAMGGGGMNFYGELPDSYNMVLNSNHRLVEKILEQKEKKHGTKIVKILEELKPVEEEKSTLEKAKEGKKEEEINQADKDKLTDVDKKIEELKNKKKDVLAKYGSENKYVKQLIDLALLANNMLKGEDLTKFVKRSIDIIK
ncbi:MAG: molecular chaperone HtpG, partial [Bacteroidales bacterium]|nr:molecular chaperone HtpG [Bacteroidales bacterium]